MFKLKPISEKTEHNCPNCRSSLTLNDWTITGMRNLADLHCNGCKSEFYGDLPAGQALYTPILLEKNSGEVFDRYEVGWFAEWVSEAFKNRINKPIDFQVKKFSESKEKVILLNCLDTIYGHSLLKLLNAQHYIDNQTDYSLIVLIPSFLEWMLPKGITEAWIVDLPLKEGIVWNDWLADEIKKRLKSFSEIFLSVAFSHPHSEDFDIARFTGVKPFPLEDFGKHQGNPIITFAWRNDRLWEAENQRETTYIQKIKRRFQNDSNLKSAENIIRRISKQNNKIIEFAESLKVNFPKLDFAVTGIGKYGDLPDWIKDLRLRKMNAETERNWCRRYAESHIVVGVVGSNMLLPSAHAGGVIDLVSNDRWNNFMQDILFRYSDPREMFFRYRFVPNSILPEELANLALGMLKFEGFRRLMSPEFSRHQDKYNLSQFLSKKVN